MIPAIVRSGVRRIRLLVLPSKSSSLLSRRRAIPSTVPILRRSYSSASKSYTLVPRWTPPEHCPGCGAPGQQTDPALPGYYYPLAPTKRIRAPSTRVQRSAEKLQQEENLWMEAIERVHGDADVLRQLGIDPPGECEHTDGLSSDMSRGAAGRLRGEFSSALSKSSISPPVCNRCHNLIHHHYAPSLPAYPTLDTLSKLLLASLHKHNHIYHLVDAADFPLSLHAELRNHLYTTLPKSITRHLTISYVITRCDVLMPKRDQISSLMSYFKSVIKQVLPEHEKVEGHTLSNIRLHAVSSRTGWDIGPLKQEISKRQGGVWLLGAVNVGKSSLLREVWPAGGELKPASIQDAAEFEILSEDNAGAIEEESGAPKQDVEIVGNDDDQHKVNEFMDQARGKTEVPSPKTHLAPTISDVPGTTAAPIRVAYKSVGRGGKFRGELVDLPGLERWMGFGETGLMKYVRENSRKELVMRKRVKPTQHVIKPGQSMLIGGLIMITPLTTDCVMVNPFTVLSIHVSSTAKCIRFLHHPDPSNALDGKLLQDPSNIGILDGAPVGVETRSEQWDLPSAYVSAGVYTLSNDVTIARNPRLTHSSPEAVAKLPYKVLATDIVLEGLGWLEITAQVRNSQEDGFRPIDVEVFSPDGKGIGQRKTMGAYALLQEGAKVQGLTRKTLRPRKSMKGHKKMMKRKQ